MSPDRLQTPQLGVGVAAATPTRIPTRGRSGPLQRVLSEAERQAMDALVVRACADGGVIDASSIAYPAHELLTHLVLHHGLLLHGTNNADLEIIEPRPAHDFGTHVDAVVAADDGIWPL